MSLTINLFPGGFISRPPILLLYNIVNEGISENEECLIFTLSVNEDDLDERDRGALDFVRSVLLLRIEDTDPDITCSQAQSLAEILVGCDVNFAIDQTTCSFDGTPAEPCK